jgi:hypothetical protein
MNRAPWRRRLLVAAILLAFAGWTSVAFVGGIALLEKMRPSIQSLTGATSPRDALTALYAARLTDGTEHGLRTKRCRTCTSTSNTSI